VDFYVNNSENFWISSSGNIHTVASVIAGTGGFLDFGQRSTIQSPQDGNVSLLDNAGTGFSCLQLGGTSASFGGLCTNGLETDAKSADSSIFAPFGAVAFVARGSTPTLTGTCTTATQVGGNTAGSFLATCTAQTVIITFATTAPNGWVCNAHDISTPTDVMNQTATAVGSCTLTGTTIASDKIVFNAVAY
jgi:hypothetical protein